MQTREHARGGVGGARGELVPLPLELRDTWRAPHAPLIGWRAPPAIIERIQAAAPAFNLAGTGVAGGSASPAWPTHSTDHVALCIVTSRAASDPGNPGLS